MGGIFDGWPFGATDIAGNGGGWLGLALPAPDPGGVGPPQPGIKAAGGDAMSASAAGGTESAANPFAALFANPTPTSSPATTPGIGDRLGAAFMNFANARGFLPAIAGAANGLATGQRTDPVGWMQAQQAAATQSLVVAGLSPALAQAAVRNPALLQALAPQLMRSPPATATPSTPAPQPARSPGATAGQ